MYSCSPSCVVHERYEASSSSADSRCWVKLERREFVSSESDLVFARPMIEADPLTMLLDVCKRVSPAVEIRACAHDVDKRSFILVPRVLHFRSCELIIFRQVLSLGGEVRYGLWIHHENSGSI
jgi:hypothetical protein